MTKKKVIIILLIILCLVVLSRFVWNIQIEGLNKIQEAEISELLKSKGLKIDELAKQVESDLYIMPSSVHETIAVSTDMGEPEELAKMVSEINPNRRNLL